VRVPVGLMRWLINLTVRQQAALTSGVLAVITVAIVLPLLRMRAELSDAKRTSAAWEERYHSEQKTSSTLQAELATNQSPAGAAVFSLETARSTQGPPVNKIAVSTSVPWIVFSLANVGQPGSQSYRAILKDSAGSTVWRAEGLFPIGDTLAIVVPSKS